EKIEPQAVVVQSVTNFPVLVSLANEDQKLLPGMNGDVSLVVDHRSDVVAVPADAVRSLREAIVLAPSLGLDADSLKAQVRRWLPGGGGGRWRAGRDSTQSAAAGGGRWHMGADSSRAGRGRWSAGGDSTSGRGRHHGGGRFGGMGGMGG